MADAPVEAVVTGVVWKIERRPGDAVDAGDVLMILESMKMEIPVEAPVAGVVKAVGVAEGDSVAEGQVVAVVRQA